jgi:hypothetical protein
MLDMQPDWLVLYAAEATGILAWLVFLVVVAVFAVPFGLGSLIARTLKLKDLGFKMGVILLTAVLGLTPFVWQEMQGKLETLQYQDELAAWEAKQEQFRVTDEGVAKLKKALPGCKINR